MNGAVPLITKPSGWLQCSSAACPACSPAVSARHGQSMAGVGTGSAGGTQCATEPRAMESWLLDVKRVRIPRPKFQTGALRYPAEPPKDYYLSDDDKAKRSLEKATEELRRGIQEKL